jgi:hypothetical protein
MPDFNLTDAFKVLAYGKANRMPLAIAPKRKTVLKDKVIDQLTDLELNCSLISLPGQMITGDPAGCNLFIKRYARRQPNGMIDLEDFVRCFLPLELNAAKKLLSRRRRVDSIRHIKEVFNMRTFAQFSLTWKTMFQELRQIEAQKKEFMYNNCYDIERIYFAMDLARKGSIDRFDVKLYLTEQGFSGVDRFSEDDIDYIMAYFDSKGMGRIMFDDFVNAFI